MKHKALFNPILILSLLLVLMASPLASIGVKASGMLSPSIHGDMFVLGTDSDYSNPILFRMDTNGTVLWDITLPFSHFLNQDVSADRNQLEDSFYMIADSYFRSNQIDGKNRVLKYDSQGVNEWDVPISPNAVYLSANPVYGGVYVSDANLGIYRMDSQGNIVWGPKNYGLTNVTSWSVSTDLTDGGAFIAERNNGLVMKIDANGNVIWSQAVPLPERIDACPIDGGVYVGSDSYARDTYKLAADGTVEWVQTYFPSLQNPPRSVNPFDGSLYAIGAWPNQFARISLTGNILWVVPDVAIGGLPIAVDLQEGGGFAYTSEMWNHLGITKINAANGSVIWRKDPGFYVYHGGDPSPSYLVYSGLPANLSSATLTATTNSTNIYPGDPVSVDLNIQNANGLYAAQAICSVDPGILTPQDGTYGGFFDPVNRLVIPIIVDAETGTWTAAISQRSPALPLSGGGLFATANFLAAGPGTTTITCEPLLSDKDGFTQSVTYTGTSVTVLPFATISGIASYQGQLSYAGITVSATGTVSRSGSSNGAGNYTVAQLKTGSYTIEAVAPGYLPNCTNLSVTSGQNATLPDTLLMGGDANNDEAINIGDATLVAANFGLQAPPADARADINADDTVNIQDLAILGGNFGTSGCQNW